jgi:hypothetical protein
MAPAIAGATVARVQGARDAGKSAPSQYRSLPLVLETSKRLQQRLIRIALGDVPHDNCSAF